MTSGRNNVRNDKGYVLCRPSEGRGEGPVKCVGEEKRTSIEG